MGKGQAGARKSISFEEWEKKMNRIVVDKKDMNRVIMDYLVTEGFFDAASAFAKETGIQADVELNTITERMAIRQALQAGQVDEAIDRVNDLNPEILDSNPHLFFHLQQLRMIEMIRNKQSEEALHFAREELVPQGEENPSFLEELEKTVTLLAFEDAEGSPLGYLMNASQRNKTASEINAAILESQNKQKESKLPVLLKLLQWSQNQLEPRLSFPRINDFTDGTIEETEMEVDE